MPVRRIAFAAAVLVLASGPATAQPAPAVAPDRPYREEDRPAWDVGDLPLPALPTLSPGTLAFSESLSLGVPYLGLGVGSGGGADSVLLSPGSQAVSTSELGLSSLAGYGYSTLGIVGYTLGASGTTALGTGYPSSIAWTDNATTQVAFRALLNLAWSRTLERTEAAYDVTVGLGLGLSANRFSYTLDSAGTQARSSFGLDLDPSLAVEWRRYPVRNREFFVFAGENFRDVLNYRRSITDDRNDFVNSVFSETRVGAGWGRILEVGASTRLRKLIRHLEARGALAAPVPPEVGDEILAHWYALRDEVGTYPQLGWTVRILQRHGLLSRPLDLEETYAALSILQDAQLVSRTRGFRADASFEFQELATQFGGTNVDTRKDHFETLSVSMSGRYDTLFGTDDTLTAGLVLHIAPKWQENPFSWLAVVGRAEFDHFFYSRHEDLTGWITAGTQLGIATAWGDYIPGIDPAPPGVTWGSNAPATVPVSFSHPAVGYARFPLWAGYVTTRFDLDLTWNQIMSRASRFSAGLNLRLQDVPHQDLAWSLSFNIGLAYGLARGSFSRYDAGVR